MTKKIIVIGAGLGGLAAALRLARLGYRVHVLEARPAVGGLASGFEQNGFTFDAGPYILLDRPGLEWAFRSLGLDLAEQITLRRIEEVYEVASPNEATVSFYFDLETTAAGFERNWPGSGARYRNFVQSMEKTYRQLQPLQFVAHPGPLDLLRQGAWTGAPFLLRSLGSILAKTNLPVPIANAIGIWTHIAGQSLTQAPSALAFVPALIHTTGAFYAVGGIQTIPQALAAQARAAGVEFQLATKVRAIRQAHGRVSGIETKQGEFIAADAVVANAHGVGTYLELVEGLPALARQQLERLPLQSPGVCAYLAGEGIARPPYLHFYLPGGEEKCRALVLPVIMEPETQRAGEWPARLISPMDYQQAQAGGVAGQRAYLNRLLAETWWRDPAEQFRVLATRLPADWGAEYHLYQDSMNPVMTAQFMRQGRLAHRSPYVPGLYLAGSSTHPGQWVSFCAISGLLAADQLHEAEA